MEPKVKKPQVKELTEQLAKMTELAARAQADLQNARARMERDRADVGTFASESALRRLLPVIDGFQRAFLHLPAELTDHEWVRGIVAIEADLMKQVGAMGLTRMQSLGATLDPSKHEVLMTGEGDEGKILEVFEEGYELGGKVLRVAKVKVGANTAGNDHPSPQNS